jgi:hypothetical protein
LGFDNDQKKSASMAVNKIDTVYRDIGDTHSPLMQNELKFLILYFFLDARKLAIGP